MSMTASPTTPTPAARPWFGRLLLYLLLVVVIFTFPNPPAPDLDASWRMALGQFLLEGLQFGHDVVFTYGPLGFLMGKTYYGSAPLFASLLLWQLFAALVFARIIMLWGERLAGKARFFYYGFFLLFGIPYEDALHMLMIALTGFELFRRLGRPRSWGTVLLLLLLALLGGIKFTNLLLGLLIVLIAIAHELWHRRGRDAARLAAWYAGGFLTIWLLCRQSLAVLPEYFINSWHVSQGYQAVMGIATPPAPLLKGLSVLVIVALYAAGNLWSHPDRPRTLARTTLLGAFIYLNWKHGFVRADGHMIGFFYAALLPIVTFPLLLDDAAGPRRALRRWVLVATGVLCLLGVRDALTGVVDQALGGFQGKVWDNLNRAANLADVRVSYDNKLGHERTGADMPRTREVVGRGSVDFIGYDQAYALFNGFHYTPRPVFQSYSAYTPELARLNADFYRSTRAPDFVLLRVNTIDERLPAMDDSAVLYLISHRYEYVLSEKSFLLWRKKPGAFDPAPLAPVPLQTRDLALGQAWDLTEYQDRKLWLRVDLAPSLLGRLRNFFYKPPHVYLDVTDATGKTSSYRMAPPIGRAGFILSPVVEDLMSYINFTAGEPGRTVHRITVRTGPGDERFFTAIARAALSSLTPSLAGRPFFDQVNRERFYMFKSVPVAFEAQSNPSVESIDGQTVMLMHAPSEMTFDLPEHATEINGAHGFLPSAYTNGNNTNGADFTIVWSDGRDSRELYHRYLDPVSRPEDRGLHKFHLELKDLSGGRIYFRAGPGPYNNIAWDWVGWTGIEIK